MGSAARPGSTSEITACRHDRLTVRLRAAGLKAVADLGFVGLDDSGPDADPAVITGYKAARNRPLTSGQKLSNKALAAAGAPIVPGRRPPPRGRFLNAILCVNRTGIPWRYLLLDYPHNGSRCGRL